MDLTTLQKYRDILDKLKTTWQEVKSSKSLHVVLIEGESGMYKTELVESFLHTSQIPSIAGYGAEIPEAYLPLRLAFESIIDIEQIQKNLSEPPREIPLEWQMTLTAFAQILPLMNLTEDPAWKLLRRWQPSELGWSSVSSDRLEADEPLKPVTLPGLFTVALGELSTQFPFVFFIDDLNLADTATLEALRFEILPSLKNVPVCFVATFDSLDNLSIGLFSELLEFVRNIPETKHLRLSRLSEEEIEVLLQNQLPAVDPTALAPHIYDASERKLAQAQDIIRWLKPSDVFISGELPYIPEHATLIQKQFEQLSSSEQAILQTASIQGLYFCLESVAFVLNQDIEDVIKNFNQDSKMGFFAQIDTTVVLENQQVHWCHFRGRNKRAWIYKSIPQKQRVKYYGKIAFALEKVYGDDASSVAGLLARHFERGNKHKKAAHYFAQLAERSNAQGAADQALKYAEKGLDNLKAVNEPETGLKCELLMQKGHALQNTGQAHRAVGVLRDALELSQGLGDSSQQMETMHYLGDALLSLNAWDEGMALLSRAVKLAVEQKQWNTVADGMEVLRDRYYKRGESEEFFTLCDRLVFTLREETSPRAIVTVAEILEDKGWLFYQQRKNNEALESLDQALAHLEKLSDPDLYPEVYYKIYRYRAEVLRLLTDYPKALQEADKAIEWAKVTRNRGKQALARQPKATVLLDIERYEEGKQVYERALDLLRYSSDLSTLAYIEEHYGLFLSKLGEKCQARDLYQHSYEHRLAINEVYNLQTARNNLAAMDKHFGAFQSALAIYQQLLSDGLAQNDKSRQSVSLNHLGDIYRILNQLEEAVQAHSTAERLCEEIHRTDRQALAIRRLGQVYLCGWQLHNAEVALNESKVLYDANIASPRVHRRVEIFSSRLALYRGNYEKASNLLREVVEVHSRLQGKLWTGIALLNQGLINLSMGKLQEVLTAPTQALEIFQQEGLWRDSEAHHLLARCHLALGNLDEALDEIEQAKSRFMDLGLFHRVYQAESTELHIIEAREQDEIEKWRVLSEEELRYDFNHLGI
jgi:tetratricopeptide (TPR) repeat protein